MNAYNRYLAEMLELKEKELNLYKNFIETRLKCTIRETVESHQRFGMGGMKDVRFKVITIPQSQYVIQIDD